MGWAPTVKGLERSIGAVAISVVAAIAVAWAAELTWQREIVLATAERRVANLALILSEYVREDFEAVDRTLKVVTVLGRGIGGATAPASEWERILAPTRASMPEVGSMTVTDAEGVIRYSTLANIIGQSRRDRYLLRRLAEETRDVLVVDTPFRTRGGRGPLVLPLGRRLTKEDGSFGGTVVATFRPEASRQFFRTVDVGREGALWVFHPDGLLLFGEASPAHPLGESAKGNAIFEEAQRHPGAGVLRRRVTAGGASMVGAYRTLAEPRLVVAVAASEREVLADWRRVATSTGGAVALFALLLGGGFGVLLRQNEARNKAEAALVRVQKLEALGQLTGGVAHDFNNLLTVVLGYAGVLRLEFGAQGSPGAIEAIDHIERAAQSGAEITQRLLAFARRQPLKVEVVDLNELVGRTAPLLRRFLNEDIELRLRLDPLACAVRLDPVLLESMLVNLGINARDAMPRGGLLEVATKHSTLDNDQVQGDPGVPAGRYVELTVSDTGAGMPPDVLAQAFEPFFTTKEPGRGTGLGLSMVFGFVRQSGGQVRIYSEVGRGTVIRSYFPCAPVAKAPGERRETIGDDLSGAGTILLVEDDPGVRSLTARMLRAAGYRVVEASDGRSALAVAEAEPVVDLLLTDVVMPGGMGGPELAEQMRARRPGLRVLLASGYSEELVRYRGDVAHSATMLAKPFDRSSLLRAVRDVLRSPPPD